MKHLLELRRSALRCGIAGVAVCGGMLGILALQGRLVLVREQLFGAPASADPEWNTPRGSAVPIASLAASTAFFTLPAPCDAAALAALERELVGLRERQLERTTELLQRERVIEEREQRCATWEARLGAAEDEVQQLATRIELRAAELERELALFDAAAEAAERRASRTLAEMPAAIAATTLAAQTDPIAAARVFAHLPADQQAAIAAALSDEQRTQFWPAWLRVERARRVAAGRKPQ